MTTREAVGAVLARDGGRHAVYRPENGYGWMPVCPELLDDDVARMPQVSVSAVSCPVCADFVSVCAGVAVREPAGSPFRGILLGLLFTGILAVWALWVWTLYSL